MQIPSLEKLSDVELLSAVKDFKGDECRAIAEVVLHLAEIDSRQLYREAGYGSLFSYCRSLGYSEGGAQRRIIAARCLRDNPEVYGLLRNGSISLCAVSEMAKVIEPQNKKEVIALFRGTSHREAQKVAVSLGAPLASKRETIRAKKVVITTKPQQELRSNKTTATVAVGKTVAVDKIELKYDLSLEVDPEFMELLNEAKRYGNPGKVAEVIKRVLKEYVERRRPKAAVKKQQKVASVMTEAKKEAKKETAKVVSPSRYIPRGVKDEVKRRDGGRCTYVGPDGMRCSENAGLQFDHVVPFAVGGSSSASNLCLKCSAHNQLAAERFFGPGFMARKRART